MKIYWHRINSQEYFRFSAMFPIEIRATLLSEFNISGQNVAEKIEFLKFTDFPAISVTSFYTKMNIGDLIYEPYQSQFDRFHLQYVKSSKTGIQVGG